jgi:hypothetical protein
MGRDDTDGTHLANIPQAQGYFREAARVNSVSGPLPRNVVMLLRCWYAVAIIHSRFENR